MTFKPIEFSQANALYDFINRFKMPSRESNRLVCRAYQGDIYYTDELLRFLKNRTKEERKNFNKLLLPQALHSSWSLLYLPNFEAFIQQWNIYLYHHEFSDSVSLNTTGLIQWGKIRYNNTRLFELLKKDLNKLTHRLNAFKKLNQEKPFLHLPLTTNNLAELTQVSANYLPTLYKSFLRITFIQQVKLKQYLLHSQNSCEDLGCKSQLQEWIDEIDEHNVLIKAFLTNAIKRMRANHALMNAIKIKLQLLMNNDLSKASIQEKIQLLKAQLQEQKESNPELQKTMQWLIPSTIWGSSALLIIGGLVCLALLLFLKVALPAVITLAVLYLVCMSVAGFITPTDVIEYCSQKMNAYLEEDSNLNQSLLDDVLFLENYSKLDKEYLDLQEPHHLLIEALLWDLKEMGTLEKEMPFGSHDSPNHYSFFKPNQDSLDQTNHTINANTI